jgi:hypothetical protein
MQPHARMTICLFSTWISHFIATVQAHGGNMSLENRHLLILDCHNSHVIVDNVWTTRRRARLNHSAITYISLRATVGCILLQAIQNYVPRILRCLDTSKQKESYKERRFGLMGFIGFEKKSHTKQTFERGLKQLAYGH